MTANSQKPIDICIQISLPKSVPAKIGRDHIVPSLPLGEGKGWGKESVKFEQDQVITSLPKPVLAKEGLVEGPKS